VVITYNFANIVVVQNTKKTSMWTKPWGRFTLTIQFIDS